MNMVPNNGYISCIIIVESTFKDYIHNTISVHCKENEYSRKIVVVPLCKGKICKFIFLGDQKRYTQEWLIYLSV